MSLAFTPLAERRTESWFPDRSDSFCSDFTDLYFSGTEEFRFLSNRFLGDPRCATLLYLIVLALPAASVHSCICGYHYGLQRTSVPAISQLLEQFVRISSVFVLYFIFIHSGVHPEIPLAVSGIIFGELAAAGYSLFSLKKKGFDADSPYILSISKSCSELLRLSVPLTVNRTAITFLQGIEAASIPVCLELASHSASEALSIYGVLTGMALPCILFPVHSLTQLACF